LYSIVSTKLLLGCFTRTHAHVRCQMQLNVATCDAPVCMMINDTYVHRRLHANFTGLSLCLFAVSFCTRGMILVFQSERCRVCKSTGYYITI